MLPNILPNIPQSYDRYFEPFLGGGSVFFNLPPNGSYRLLSDINQELIITYHQVKDNLPGVIAELSIEDKYINTKECFDGLRHKDNPHRVEEMSDVERAARLIYLQATSNGGIYRVNRANGYNVPFGRRPNPTICNKKHLTKIHNYLNEVPVKIYRGNFFELHPRSNDFLFIDPPYFPLDNKPRPSFTGYSPGGFNMLDHENLVDTLKKWDKDGVLWLLMNSDTKFVREGFSGYNIEEVVRTRTIDKNPSYELLIKNY